GTLLRLRLEVFCFLSSLLLAAATLVFDKNDFLSEQSWMTPATALMLGCASLLAYINYWITSRGRWPLAASFFWMILCAVFLGAALGEQFMIHEHLGRVLN